jgi:uncharacterized iron-regulated protein
MRSRALRNALLVASAAALCACARAAVPAAPSGSAGHQVVLPAGADVRASARRIARLARDADVIYLGEQHDNPEHHAQQRAVVGALVSEGMRPALAFEMLNERQQPAVDRAMAEPSTPEELGRRLEWKSRGWPDFSMYWPLFELARRDRLPVLAIDLDPAVVRRIAREGRASVAGPRESLDSLLPVDRERDAAVTRSIRDGHCGLLPESRLPFMVQAWHARNVTMARHIAAAVDGGRPVVVIIGRGHQDPGGLPAQLAALRPGTRQFVVSMVEMSPDAGAEPPVEATTADVVWRTRAVDRGDPCAGLRPRA